VAKTLALEDAIADGKIRSALNYGEQMDASTLGGWSLDALKSGSSRTVATVGFPNSISFVKLYDGFNAPKSADDFIASLQNNHYIVNHLGHAFQNYVFRMKDDRIVDLPPLPGFFYSQGCYPNDPDVVNWSQKAVVTPGVGPAAMIANTRYGWYGPGQGNEGPSNVLHRAFWSARFKEGIRQIGRMNHRAKQLAIAGQATSLMRYTALESNLMGDPSLDLGLPSN
jgi:hypothetical protein